MADEKLKLQVNPRKITGRAVKVLRRQGLVPANVFGKKRKSVSVQLSAEALAKIYKAAGETSIINLQVEGEKEQHPVLISGIQFHSVTGLPLHADFHEVDLTQKVTATVPLELLGESPAVTDLGGVIVQQLNEIEVEALPMDLPDKLTLDISSLKEFGDTLTIADLKVDATKIQIEVPAETIVVQAQEPQKEEEPAPVVEEGTEGETPAEGAEGETKEEGKPEAKEEAAQ